jgi:type IV pilus biogenesis protein CpaD/CtpE
MSLTGETKKSQVVVITLTGTMNEADATAWNNAVAALKRQFGVDRLTITWVQSAPPSVNVTTEILPDQNPE